MWALGSVSFGRRLAWFAREHVHERMTAAASFLLVRACRVGHGWTRLHHTSRWVGDVWVSGRPTSDERPPPKKKSH